MHLDDRALRRDRVAGRGFVIGPGDVFHRARIRHCAWLMHRSAEPRIVAVLQANIPVTVPRLSQDREEARTRIQFELNPVTVWHHPKNGHYERQSRESFGGG